MSQVVELEKALYMVSLRLPQGMKPRIITTKERANSHSTAFWRPVSFAVVTSLPP